MKSNRNHSPYVPSSVHESEELLEFSNKFLVFSLVAIMVLSCSFSIIAQNNDTVLHATLSIYRVLYFPFAWAGVTDRWDELGDFDRQSQIAYAVSYVCGVLFIPIVAFVMLERYFHFVVRRGKGLIDKRALLGSLIIVLSIVGLFWFFYIMPVDLVGVRHLGTHRIFLWPLFNFIGSFVFVSIIILIFSLGGGLLKLAFRKGGKARDS